MPLELKTGKASHSSEHRGQVKLGFCNQRIGNTRMIINLTISVE